MTPRVRRTLYHLAVLLCLWAWALLHTSDAVAQVPEAAKQHLPTLVSIQRDIWPDAPMPEFLAAQIEKESCITLKHSKCWNPRAELKTPRENGIGFGQFTRAYKADGSIRFDKISELAAAHASLRGWSWERRYDPRFQLIAIVEMDKGIFSRQRGAATVIDRLSFALSAYNGGEGGVLQDRRLCANTPGCDPSRWAGNVEHHSMKQRVPQKGYGKSFFQINREYVRTILFERRAKYTIFFAE
jgi:hypothetical protein